MDPICCLLGICCPPESQAQLDAFTQVLTEQLRDKAKAAKIAKALHKDLIAFTKKLKKAVDGE